MVKILSQAGITLADIYDIEGSIAGVEQLRSDEVTLVHEMGQLIFSERLSAVVRRQVSGAIAQSTSFDVLFTDLPGVPYRILGTLVLVDATSRLAHCQLSVRSTVSGREMPFFMWDDADDIVKSIRIVENGGASANTAALVMLNPWPVPTMGIGRFSPQSVGREIAFRGTTSAFGAGNVNVTALVYFAFSQIGGLRSSGLPIPSW